MRNDPYPQPQEARLRDFFSTIRRRWILFLATILVIMALAVIYTLQLDPVYRSQVSILVQGRSQQFGDSGDIMNPLNQVTLTPSVNDVPSQIEVLQGYSILKDAMQEIGVPPPPPSPDLISDPFVSVQQAGMTNVLMVSVDSKNANLASELAAEIPQAYSDFQRNNLQSELTNAVRFAQGRFAAAKAHLDETMASMQKLRKKTGITDIDADTNYALRTYADTKSVYNQAQQNEADAKSSLDSLLASLSSTPKQITDKASADNQAYLLQQESKLADLKGQLAQAQVLYKNSSPKVQQLQSQVQQQEDFVKSLPSQVNTGRVTRNPLLDTLNEKIAGSRAAYQGAVSALQVAQAKMDAANDKLSTITSQKGEYQQEMQAVLDAQNGLGKAQSTLLDLEQRQSEAKSPVQIVGDVTRPFIIKPKWTVYMAAALIFAIAVALGVVAVIDKKDDRVYTIEQARAIAGSRNLGAVPLPNSARSLVVAGDMAQAENFRMLRSNLLFTVGGEAMRSIAVVSARNNEGRSEIASNLAASLALGSHEVVVIDANLRRPTLHKVMNSSEGPGLTDVLLGYKSIRDVLQETDVEGLKLITAGSEAGSSTELLASEAFTTLLDDLKEQFHFIIVDTSAALASADAQVAADACDASVMVIKVGITQKSTIRFCMDLLKRTRTNVLGVIYNRPGRQANGGIQFEGYEDEVA